MRSHPVIYQQLGVRPVINASATLTKLGGSLMPEPVAEAVRQASSSFIDLHELQDLAGKRIAELTHNEAAYISSGAAAGITLSVATCIAGVEPDDRMVFPALEDVERNEVLCRPEQYNGYRYSADITGAKIVEVGGDVDEFIGAINARTACILWFAGRLSENSPPLEDVIREAKKLRVPVIVDAAAQIPPISNLWYFTKELGADVAIFSGGKGLRGPQTTGLVLGRSDIIKGCKNHGSPNHAIGRPMKVSKEDIAGAVAAMEWSLAQDEPGTLQRYEDIVKFWVDGVSDIPGVTAERGYPSEAGQPHPRAILHISSEAGVSRDELVERLWDRNPRIAVSEDEAVNIALNPQTIGPGEEKLVLQAIREELGVA
jgi:uncharacterized pyridoxal phosphate-dependent enzyme